VPSLIKHLRLVLVAAFLLALATVVGWDSSGQDTSCEFP